MSSNRKIRVRDAKPRDIGLFKKLWLDNLKENEKAGSIVATTEKNLAMIEATYNLYTSGELDGFALFVGDYGVLLAGATGAAVEHNCGKTAMLWGMFVREDKRKGGVATALVEEAKKRLKVTGFDSVIAPFTVNNEAAGSFAIKLEAKPIFMSVKVTID